jgi:hypothetical protein
VLDEPHGSWVWRRSTVDNDGARWRVIGTASCRWCGLWCGGIDGGEVVAGEARSVHGQTRAGSRVYSLGLSMLDDDRAELTFVSCDEDGRVVSDLRGVLAADDVAGVFGAELLSAAAWVGLTDGHCGPARWRRYVASTPTLTHPGPRRTMSY